jgi:Cu+-exporting ATPase
MLLFFISSSSLVLAKQTHKPHSTKVNKLKTEIKCPVTGGKVDPATAYAKSIYKGKTYYFCCAGCPEEFKKNPKKYVK